MNRVVRPYKDRLTKKAFRHCKGHSLKVLGLDYPPIVGPVPTEAFVVRSRTVDIAFRLADGSVVVIEHFSGDRPADLFHVLGGVVALMAEHQRPARVAVLYTGAVRSAPDRLDAGHIQMRVDNVFGEQLDGDAALDACLARVAAGVPIEGDDAMALALVGTMRHTRRSVLEAMRTALAIAGQLPSEDDRESCAAAVMLFAQARLTERDLQDLVEVFRMAAPRMAEVLERLGRAKGRAEGRAEGLVEGSAVGEAESILKVLSSRWGAPSAASARRIRAERDRATLDRWLTLAATCTDLAEFERRAFACSPD